MSNNKTVDLLGHQEKKENDVYDKLAEVIAFELDHRNSLQDQREYLVKLEAEFAANIMNCADNNQLGKLKEEIINIRERVRILEANHTKAMDELIEAAEEARRQTSRLSALKGAQIIT